MVVARKIISLIWIKFDHRAKSIKKILKINKIFAFNVTAHEHTVRLRLILYYLLVY